MDCAEKTDGTVQLYNKIHVFYIMFFLKILNGMANSVEPDQMAPEGAV